MREGILSTQRVPRAPAYALALVLGLVLSFSFSVNTAQSINLHTVSASEIARNKTIKVRNALAHYIARRFHLRESTARAITQQAYLAAQSNRVKPTLVLAIVAVESSYQPDAINTVSGARGLMQVLPRWHRRETERVGGKEALLRIRPNIQVGTEILAQYLRWERGRLAAALGRYWGSVHCEVYVYKVKRQLKHLNRVVKSARDSNGMLFDEARTST